MQVNETIKNLNSLPSEFIVIGVSAGPDSMALLHLVINNTKKKIVCAHVNHNVRLVSDEEEEYLKKYCEKFNIIFESTKIDNYSQNNFENEARKKNKSASYISSIKSHRKIYFLYIYLSKSKQW